jgi:hypothetical protein
MNRFQLTVINHGRALLAVLFFTFSIMTGLFLVITMETTALKIITPIVTIALINGAAIYYAVSNLTITTDGKTLSFDWSKKWIFNFKPIDRVNLLDIDTLVINTLPGELKEHLQYFISNNRKIKISTAKYWRKDADAFIQYLKVNSNAEIKDSWDMIKEQGLLKIPYYGISFILVAGAVVISYLILDKGISNVKPQHIFGFVGSYLTLIPFWLIVRSKMKKGDNKRS